MTEHQETLWREREMQPTQHPFLGFGVEVHQRVSTDQQIDARDGGVLDKIVTTEDYGAAQVLPKRVPAADLLEVSLQQMGGTDSTAVAS